MKVYVLTMGCYEDRYILGVYATAQLAMKACEVRLHTRGSTYQANDGSGERPLVDMRWRANGDSTWVNDGDWDDAAMVEQYEVEDER